MLDYARQRAVEALGVPRTAVLVTSGPAGLQAGEYPCEAVDVDLYLLVPWTSDHLFNLEQHSSVTLLAAGWELNGVAQVVSPTALDIELDLLREPGAQWCGLVRVAPRRMQLRREKGWGYLETIELEPSRGLDGKSPGVRPQVDAYRAGSLEWSCRVREEQQQNLPAFVARLGALREEREVPGAGSGVDGAQVHRNVRADGDFSAEGTAVLADAAPDALGEELGLRRAVGTARATAEG
jgi:hypothetical protein